MLKFFLLAILIVCHSCFAKCPTSSAGILVINDSPYRLRLESKEEKTCKLHHIGDVKPRTKEKYFCIDHKYMIKVTTYHKKIRVAISATDTWNDIIIYAKEGVFDVKFKHLRGDESLTGPQKHKSLKWYHHKHDSEKHNKKNRDHSTESLHD